MLKLWPGLLLLGLAACRAGQFGAAAETGLEGYVLRGPVHPVCQIDRPCDDVPFAAGFGVLLEGRQVAHFRSDEKGYFRVYLPPGGYSVVPDQDAPIIAPASQARAVEVGGKGLTQVTLSFDTGIR